MMTTDSLPFQRFYQVTYKMKDQEMKVGPGMTSFLPSYLNMNVSGSLFKGSSSWAK